MLFTNLNISDNLLAIVKTLSGVAVSIVFAVLMTTGVYISVALLTWVNV